MPNATLRANARTMPKDKPADIVDLGERLTNLAADPDAAPSDDALLDLVMRAKALESAVANAEAEEDAAIARLVSPPTPAVLTFTARDKELFGHVVECPIGETLRPVDLNAIRVSRETMINIYKLIDWGDREPKPSAREMLARAVDIVAAADAHAVEARSAEEAAGIPQAEAETMRLNAELERVWRAIAFTPARTLLGVLAKLDSIARTAAQSGEPDPESGEKYNAHDVAYSAAVDMAALSALREARP